MQRAVPGRDIERKLAGRAGSADHRSCRNPTGAKDPAAAEVFPPEHIAGFRFDCKDVVGDAGFNQDLLWTGAGVHAFRDQRHQQRVHLAHFIVELDLSQQLDVLRISRGESHRSANPLQRPPRRFG